VSGNGAAEPVGAAGPASISFAALGTTAVVLVTDPGAAAHAERVLRDDLDALDLACSRFRADSELVGLRDSAGSWSPLRPLLADALDAALTAAEVTDGLVDPTVADAVAGLGYDQDFAAMEPIDPRPAVRPTPAPGWWRVQFDRATRRVLLPRGIGLDLGATAKAFAADRAVARIHAETGCGALVSLGGDLAVAGAAPDGGWLVGVGDDHTGDPAADDPVVVISSGGLATSSITRRRWRRDGREVHHIVDPRTGDSAVPVWRSVCVAARSCLDANTASTAAIILGEAAPDWLARLELPARLVRLDGTVVRVAGWPATSDDLVRR
jgi:thiamine biosynthesis lipoprotein